MGRQQYVSLSRGYTLIEMLVAITVFSLILVLLSGGFFFADASRRASQHSMDSIEQIRQTRWILDRYLGAAQSVWVSRDNERLLFFNGRQDLLVFVADMPAHLGTGGLYQIRLQVVDEQDGRQLQLERQLIHPQLFDSEDLSTTSSAALIRQVSNVEFSYFGSLKDEDTGEWYSEWLNPESLPELVQVSIEQSTGMVDKLSIRIAASRSGLTPTIENFTGFYPIDDGWN